MIEIVQVKWLNDWLH